VQNAINIFSTRRSLYGWNAQHLTQIISSYQQAINEAAEVLKQIAQLPIQQAFALTMFYL
jgi:hypothetical protein